jgi:beta-galactosidase
MLKHLIPLALAGITAFAATAGRTSETLNDDWLFTKGDGADGSAWQRVRVPHDWAIYGPFDRANDLQTVAVEQNGEKEETVKTGRTGGLPFIGKGCYRRNFEVADTAGRVTTFVFDGAMSNARVSVNGREVAFWPYGYNSFYVTVPNELLRIGDNELRVDLENFERASRWYPGAGLYRNVHIVTTDRVHIPVWGTYVTTPTVSDKETSVRLSMKIDGAAKGEKITVETRITDPSGREAASDRSTYVAHGQNFAQNFNVADPALWSPESPSLYTADTRLYAADGRELDAYTTRFGIRSIEYIPERGFFLNGKTTKFKGVCNHHDLGPLGAAVNRSALRHQIELLKDMGVNAIRTSHNMPAPELVELCDEMGMMLMIEPFDDWSFRPKSPNGYGAVFNEWAEKDITNMVEHFRNSPSVVMWSIGNEVPSQWGPDGVAELTMLQDLVHALDPTRPVTCGMDQIGAVLDNGFAAALDIPGFNYKPQYYDEAYAKLPQRLILGSETASTVSSRGVYHFPVDWAEHNVHEHPDHQSNSYDNESCFWSNTPDLDFVMDDDREWVIGQFVWTGFDYLGEPSPYDTDAWPSHSSVFGIIDLASLPKDRFYLYRSKWNETDTTLHILPHWTWKGREGEVTPVFVYTNLPKAELFINGKSQGVREKNMSSPQERYRLMWNETVYEPGELKVVAYDSAGKAVAEKSVRTAGKPSRLVVTPLRTEARDDGDDLVYFTVTVEDREGNPVPTADMNVKFKVEGAGTFEATANGDPTCVMPFQAPEMKLFSGAATVIARPAKTAGKLTLKASAKGLREGKATIDVK